MPAIANKTIFSEKVLEEIFPADRADRFFEALFGDASEGAYDISLVYSGETDDRIDFEFHLKQRPGKCLACNLTYGLPDVFIRHPVIDIAGVVRRIDSFLSDGKHCGEWTLGRTRGSSRFLHAIPLSVDLLDDEK